MHKFSLWRKLWSETSNLRKVITPSSNILSIRPYWSDFLYLQNRKKCFGFSSLRMLLLSLRHKGNPHSYLGSLRKSNIAVFLTLSQQELEGVSSILRGTGNLSFLLWLGDFTSKFISNSIVFSLKNPARRGGRGGGGLCDSATIFHFVCRWG